MNYEKERDVAIEIGAFQHDTLLIELPYQVLIGGAVGNSRVINFNRSCLCSIAIAILAVMVDSLFSISLPSSGSK